ncbi:hypothetical protein E1295_35490 [Nonomuraea mesophila]|uniref:HpcH/HpaI aldolase/citrate lyase domain-containing protein n=1 Tax=Nonomuraea mesophila TaxID=2530382 RepID=A0A4R5ENF9_9ACTN|nr:aldolase/citrate lyase family protein [Nonomuraea mesophila]TDE36132.1 hypothetical protein E1295_35490 [Nonomuraea mesophila]
MLGRGRFGLSDPQAVPGRPRRAARMFAKAEAAGADAAVLDDAVPPARKSTARAEVAEAVATTAGDMALFVRINPLDGWAGAEDLRAVAHPRLAGVVLPRLRAFAGQNRARRKKGLARGPMIG